MMNIEHAGNLHGTEVYDTDGDKIGSVGQVWDDGRGRPAWASVKTGLFGLNESLVPLESADLRDERLVVPFDKATVKDAPNIDASHDEPLQGRDVERLYEYYGLSWDASASGTAGYAGTDTSHTQGRSTTAASTATDSAYAVGRASDAPRGRSAGDDAMTRSEERLNVDTRVEQTGRARLRKYVVTEQEQVSVPVQREEVRLEREPITDANRGSAFRGTDLTEAEHEVTLHAERATVETEVVPVERVRLGKETVRDEETVSGEVRKEQIEADLPDEDGRRRLG